MKNRRYSIFVYLLLIVVLAIMISAEISRHTPENQVLPVSNTEVREEPFSPRQMLYSATEFMARR